MVRHGTEITISGDKTLPHPGQVPGPDIVKALQTLGVVTILDVELGTSMVHGPKHWTIRLVLTAKAEEPAS